MLSKDVNAQPFLGAVKVGPKGQIVIPKEARDMFGIAPGDMLVVMAHPQRGIAIERQSDLFAAADVILQGHPDKAYPYERTEGLSQFANEVKRFEEEQSHNDGD